MSKQHRLISIQQHVADSRHTSSRCLENLRAMAQQWKPCIIEIRSLLDFRSFILSPRDHTKQILDGQILQAVEDNLNEGIKKDGQIVTSFLSDGGKIASPDNDNGCTKLFFRYRNGTRRNVSL